MEAVYLYDGEYKKGIEGEGLVRIAAARHAAESGMAFDSGSATITRDAKGKPRFRDVPLEFSVTHSGKMWMCLFSDKPCGVDLQIVKNCNYLKISEKMFLPDEIELVREEGIDRFFHIWVRKEAYCKMTGEGLLGDSMPKVLEDWCIFKGERYYFRDIYISEDIRCAVCTGNDAEVEMRMLG